jgi:hypothetical protein
MVTHFVRISPPAAGVVDDLSMRVRNDLNCRAWDYEYNQQLDSQSRVWTLKGAAWKHHQSECS